MTAIPYHPPGVFRFTSFAAFAMLPAVALAIAFVSRGESAETDSHGHELYQAVCARCHGNAGEGVEEEYAEPLHGDRSLDDLTEIIDQTMPEGARKNAVGRTRVAWRNTSTKRFTPRKPARNAPPRIELARLTVNQYQNSVADLFATFWGQATAKEERGIQGRYFPSRRFRDSELAFERIDPQIRFEFGTDSPAADKVPAEEFAIRWQGGLIVEDAGDYEFRLTTENGARLWLNDRTTPLVDAWVRSGDQTEYEAALRLLGGRVYPLRLDHFKFKDDTASVVLQWRPPQRDWEVIPTRNLTPGWYPQGMVVETEFPPDDSSVGYPRGTSVSAEWDQATTMAALEIAGKVQDNLESLSGCKADAKDRATCLRKFCHRFAERAFRRPLSAEQQKFFVDDLFDSVDDPELAVKRVVLLVLKSPRFLYLGVGGEPADNYRIAERLAFGLWDSLPDRELLEAAAEDRIAADEKIAYQTQRMLSDPRTHAKLRQFLHQWLKVDRVEAITKDESVFPAFDQATASDLRMSLDLFLDAIVWSEESDFRQLLLSPDLFVNERIADFYGIEVERPQPFQRVSLDQQQWAGVLTHPYLMANLSYHKSTSPIHRGVFIVRSLLGRSLKPPPIAVTPLDETFDPEMTTRERVTFQTQPIACQNCHELINPFGFSLEHYDAVGRFRMTEKQRPIDASGSYKTLGGEQVRFEGARQLAEFLADSSETQAWFVEQLFHHLVKQPVAAFGPDQLQELTRSFAASDYNIQQLLVDILRATARPASDS